MGREPRSPQPGHVWASSPLRINYAKYQAGEARGRALRDSPFETGALASVSAEVFDLEDPCSVQTDDS